MNSLDISGVVKKLVELTKQKKIEWHYLDSCKDVYQQLSLEPKSPLVNRNALTIFSEFSTYNIKEPFDADNSFITFIHDNYVVIYARLNDKNEPTVLSDRLKLLLVPKTFKDVYESVDDTDGNLVRLHTLVKSVFPNSQDIANDILSMS